MSILRTIFYSQDTSNRTFPFSFILVICCEDASQLFFMGWVLLINRIEDNFYWTGLLRHSYLLQIGLFPPNGQFEAFLFPARAPYLLVRAFWDILINPDVDLSHPTRNLKECLKQKNTNKKLSQNLREFSLQYRTFQFSCDLLLFPLF